MIDPTDENTGLPPLDEPIEADTLWVLAFTSGQADVFSPVDGSPQGCMVISTRGLVNDDNGPVWAQMHLAFPHSSITALRDRLNAYLGEYPE